MSLYDFSFKTGLTFGELYSPNKDTCIEDYFLGSLSLTSPVISGVNSSLLSLNGQTLVEQNPIFIPIGFNGIYVLSGDYAFRSGENYRNVNFTQNVPIQDLQQASFYYNIRGDKRESVVGTGISAAAKQSAVRSEMAKRFADRTGSVTGLNSFDYFANGQKIYTGLTSGSYLISGSPALFYFNDTFSGQVFAIPKNTGLKNTTGLSADVYGQRFVEATVFGYVNGCSLHRKNWLELSTGVTLIKTGVQASIFAPIKETQSISL